jgi:hypothetical protein
MRFSYLCSYLLVDYKDTDTDTLLHQERKSKW